MTLTEIGAEFLHVIISLAILLFARKALYIWNHLNILKKDGIKIRDKFIPCPYYDQLNIGQKNIGASHTILNYANFLIFLQMKVIPKRELLILDEGHQIENKIGGIIPTHSHSFSSLFSS